MKKSIKFCIIMAFFALVGMTIFSSKVNAADLKIEFKDANLYGALKNSTFLKDKITSSDDESLSIFIPEDEIKSVIYLDISNRGIEELSGIENFTSLGSLNVEENHIRSIEKIPSQNLSALHLSYIEEISDIDLLKDYSKLTNLNVSKSNLEEIPDVVKNLTALTSFSWTDGTLKNVLWITNFPNLTNLDLENNQIKSIEGIGQLKNLKRLTISGNNIESIDGLNECNLLDTLDISDNYIKDLNGISELKLVTLRASNNVLSDISSLKTEKINYLDLSNNNIADFSVIQDLIIDKKYEVSGQLIKMNIKSGEKIALPALIKQAKEKLNATEIETIKCQVTPDNMCKIDENVTYARVKISGGELNNSMIYFNVTNVQVPGVTGNTVNFTKTHIIVIAEVIIIMIISVFIVAKVKNKKR